MKIVMPTWRFDGGMDDACSGAWSGLLFSYVDLEVRVRKDHPLRKIREIANAALKDLSKDFDRLLEGKITAKAGLITIAPESVSLYRSMHLAIG